MYYTRTVWSRGVQCVAIGACVTALASGWTATLQARQELPPPVASLASGLVARDQSFSSPFDRSIELRFRLKPSAGPRGDRVIEVTTQTLRLLGEWLGPFPHPTLTVVDAPWNSPHVGEAYPGVVIAATRWLSIQRDGSADRALIAALAREYWIRDNASPSSFEEGLAEYSAARAIEVVLEGRQYWSRWFLGGFVPVAVRSLPLSSPRSQARGRAVVFDDSTRPSGASGHVLPALQSLERYIGWPALQDGLAAYRARFPHGGGAPADLMAILNEQGGRDLSWFFTEAFRPSARFDYGIERVTSERDGARHRVRVALRRYGDGIFAGTSLPRDSGAGRAIPFVIRFADDTAVHEWWDGRDQTVDREYFSAAAATSVEVDPAMMLLLDDNRTNNVRRLTPAPVPPHLWRGLASWLLWLQDFMLTSSALS